MNITLFDLISPHYCSSCGEIGDVLCEHCKYDIIDEPYALCIVCRHIVAGATNLCNGCDVPFRAAWCIGERQGSLRKILDNYKFSRQRAAHKVCASLLDNRIPILPEQIRITYVSTTPPDIRRRGYDHAELIARQFARLRGLSVEKTIDRTVNRRQLGASKRQRIENAAASIYVTKALPAVPYLLIDDIYTTGATINRASQQLLAAGASEVYVAIIARQPLEKTSRI